MSEQGERLYVWRCTCCPTCGSKDEPESIEVVPASRVTELEAQVERLVGAAKALAQAAENSGSFVVLTGQLRETLSPPERSSEPRQKGKDSPRWCSYCNTYGDHHTDRHPPNPDTLP